MLCTWSTTATKFLQGFARTRPFHRFRCVHDAAAIVPSVVHLEKTTGQDTHIVPMESSPTPLTNAQLSRATAQAVRMSISQGSLHNAFYIYNSLQYSLLDPNAVKSRTKLKGLNQRLHQFQPIPFSRPLSPRLSAHALLHGLLRRGQTIKAAKQAESMKSAGIRIRNHTLYTIFQSLTHNPLPTPPDPGRIPLETSDALRFRPSMASNHCTQFALRLFCQAEEYHFRASARMYQRLINACLLQGELIVGCLLFCLVVKDWQRRTALKGQLQGQADSLSHADNGLDVQLTAQREIVHQELLQLQQQHVIVPSWRNLNRLAAAIEASYSAESPTDTAEAVLHQKRSHASLQALANLANLLDTGQIPYGQISSLIRALYQCPRGPEKVWIPAVKKNGQHVNAHHYFNSVLMRLIRNLPSRTESMMQPPLDLPSYNSLLHYALRHRLSPALAHSVLAHMTQTREPVLEPDIATHNILLRSGTLLRRPDIVQQALKLINKEALQTIYTEGPDLERPLLEEKHLIGRPFNRYGTALVRLDTEALTVPAFLQCLNPDPYTITSYITHLVSTGQPELVADLLFHLVPELLIIDHPSLPSQHIEVQRSSNHNRKRCLQRAVKLGPQVFSSLLNALQKAGKTGLAERVWLLAKDTERCSWVKGFVPGAEPWCLSIHSYTSMMQCYAQEAKKGVEMRRRGKEGAVLRARQDLEVLKAMTWVPRPHSKRYIIGWARYITWRRRLRPVRRSYGGRLMAVFLHHQMQAGIHRICQSLVDLRKEFGTTDLRIPLPDARFFNAWIQSLRFLPRSCVRARMKRTYHRRRLFRTQERYARLGVMSNQLLTSVNKIGRVMVEHGYAIPPALRFLFVGRWRAGTVSMEDVPLRTQMIGRPWAFPNVPPKGKFRAYGARTLKTRGLLPLRSYKRQ